MTPEQLDTACLSLLKHPEQFESLDLIEAMKISGQYRDHNQQHMSNIDSLRRSNSPLTLCHKQYQARLLYIGMLLQKNDHILG